MSEAGGHGLVEDGWLSEILHRPSFHLKCDMAALAAVPLPHPSVPNYFIDAKVDVARTDLVAGLTGAGFLLADTNLTLAADIRRVAATASPLPSVSVGFALPQQREGVAALAGRAFEFDRFHRDSMVGKDRADELKARWAENFFFGKRGDWMVTAVDAEAGVVGFLQLLGGNGKCLVIDLVAVDRAHRGRGIGRDMIAFAAANCPNNGAMQVGTQVANEPSLVLYAKLGFTVRTAQYVLHAHGRNDQRSVV